MISVEFDFGDNPNLADFVTFDESAYEVIIEPDVDSETGLYRAYIYLKDEHNTSTYSMTIYVESSDKEDV